MGWLRGSEPGEVSEQIGEKRCPRCGRRVFSVVIRGPTECHATPCGCRVPCHEDFDEVLDGVG